jgi:signal transduction histidine kinase
MKLLTKTTLYIATLSLFLFFIMGIIFFQILKNMSLSELNRELMNLKEMVDAHLTIDPGNLSIRVAGIDSLSITGVSKGQAEQACFGDTLMLDHRSHQYRTYRYLMYQSDMEGGPYHVKIFKSTTPTDQLVERVTLMMTIMVILFLAGVFILNRFVFANLWKDFFNALEKLREFDSAKEPVILGEQDIEEFIELKRVLEKMTRQLSKDYRELKEYTDHTTHELQTPLAVIKSKTELLMQSKNLGPEEMSLIQAINTSTNHLSRLNSTLTLITRIENRQFPAIKEMNLPRLLDRHLEMLQELVDLRGIRIHKDYSGADRKLRMDEGLADVLIANLLKNAIVHNLEGGIIGLEVGPDNLVILNDGLPLPFSGEEIFKRFVRNTGERGSFGLGLSLVKKICEYYGFGIGYAYEGGQHIFTITFSD